MRASLPAVLAVTAAMAAGGCGTLRASWLVADATRPPEELADSVDESDARVARPGAAALDLRIVEPRGEPGPRPAFLLVHGAHEEGGRHPAMVSLARALARRGATVGVLDLAALRDLRIDADDVGRIGDAALWLADRGDLAEDGRVALFGISVGGSYAIAAAAQEPLAGRVSCVFAFGAYADLDALLLRLLVAPPRGESRLLDPLGEGRRRLLLGNVDALVPARDRGHVAAALTAMIAGGDAPPDPAELSAEARSVLAAARSRDPLPPQDARALVGRIAAASVSLSPGRLAQAPSAPVYLLHGRDDPLVPASDCEVLRDALEARGVTVSVHVTDLYSHVDPAAGADASFFDAWPLLRFVADAMSDAGL
jgi:dienelactone hydrolase